MSKFSLKIIPVSCISCIDLNIYYISCYYSIFSSVKTYTVNHFSTINRKVLEFFYTVLYIIQRHSCTPRIKLKLNSIKKRKTRHKTLIQVLPFINGSLFGTLSICACIRIYLYFTKIYWYAKYN